LEQPQGLVHKIIIPLRATFFPFREQPTLDLTQPDKFIARFTYTQSTHYMNSVVHFEIPAGDRDRAKKFYQTVFEWQMMDFDEKNTMVSTTDSDDNGLPKAPGAINGSIYLPEKPRTPTIVIDVPDIKAHIEKIKKNGGTLVDDIAEIPGMGMYARFRDPEGNLMGLWQTL
jgi:predicted enzyme related to lactoylglutathione lyase